MADVLNTLIIDYMSRGLAKVEKDMKDVSAQADKSKSRLADLQQKLNQYRAIQLKNGTLTNQEAKDRKAVLGSIIVEQSRLRNIQRIQETIGASLNSQKESIKDSATAMGKVSKAGAALQSVGNFAAGAFGAATAGIMGLVRAADPNGFAMFETKLTVLAMAVGRIFIPIIRDATDWISQLTGWFDRLSGEERQQIRDWARIGLTVLGTVAAFALLGKTLAFLISGFGGLVSVVRGGIALWPLLASAGVTAFSLISSAVQGTMVAMRALWALAAAHPIAAIAAVAALAGGYLLLNKDVEKATDSIAKLNSLSAKLEGGGRATFKDLTGLRPEDRSGYVKATGDKARREEAAKQKKEADEELKTNTEGEADKRSGAIRQGLEDTQGLSKWTHNLFGLRTIENARKAAIQKRLEESGVSKEESKGLAEEAYKQVQEKFKGGLFSHKETLSPEEIEEAASVARKKRAEALAKKKVAESVLEKGIGETDKSKPGGGKKVEDDTPTVMPHTPQLLGDVFDLWKKSQTATQGDPRLEVQQRLLNTQVEALEKLKNIDEKAGRRGAGLGR